MVANSVESLVERCKSLLPIQDEVGRHSSIPRWRTLKLAVCEQAVRVADPQKAAGRKVRRNREDEFLCGGGVPNKVALEVGQYRVSVVDLDKELFERAW